MRDRLIELLCRVECKGEEDFGNCPHRVGGSCNKVQRLEMCSVFVIADHLLANGVIVLPCKVGETVYADIIHRRNGDFIDECEVKFIEWDSDWDEPLFTIICRDRATYRTYWASEFGKEFFKEPRFAEKKPSKKKGAQG